MLKDEENLLSRNFIAKYIANGADELAGQRKGVSVDRSIVALSAG